jgi:hydrogenase/urease accessory protein HupE
LFGLLAVLGGFTNLSGVSLPELAVPLTVLIAGVLLWKRVSSVVVATILATVAGFANGAALIENAPTNVSSIIFALGCLTASGLLNGLGLLLGNSLRYRPTLTRVAAAFLVAGAALVTVLPELNSALIRILE